MVSGTSDSHVKKSSRRKLLDISTTETEKDKLSAKNTKKQQRIVQSKSPSKQGVKNNSVKNRKISLEHERHSKKRSNRSKSPTTSSGSDSSLDASKHWLEHDISDSDQSVEREIHSIAEQHAKSSMDEMSDFSIASPKKKRKLRIIEAKTTADSSDENSGDEEPLMSQSIFSTSTSGSQLKGSSRVHKKKRKSHTIGNIESDQEDMTNQTEQNLKLRYNIPEGYEPSKLTESNTDMCKEDLRHKDLWLIKAPVNFDIQNLNGMAIDLNGCTEFSSKDDELYEVDVTEDTTNEMSTFAPILPSREKSSFVLGPKFRGQIHVMQSLEIPDLPAIKIPEPIAHKIPKGLIPRFEPFGSGDPVKLGKRKHHDHKGNKSNSSSKSHKKKHHQDEDYLDGDQLDKSVEKKLKKELKKRIKKELD
ncbi:uncharacterized protein LOC127729171 [Mytilus californianus]|uniref:uncharacterized protein LOC127729171 n=1 Tax=Mytilus californianus TaxID=6549 RepID=UPI00224781D4|nr:uncharacterized protein LOC127729171 [Mytilus californianus]XP_052092826.1 uncharacterized protein LOC127729171 [Mytilus californianus]